MQASPGRFALAFTTLAAILGTGACGGGGGDEATSQAPAACANVERATVLAARKPPPPPPPAPTTDATLALASASASGQAVDGDVCAVSADGGKVLFTPSSNTLVAGDVRPFAADIFMKNFNGNGVTRAVTTVSRTLTCLTITPDASTLVFIANATNGQVDVFGNSGTEPAIMVKNLATGQQTRVTPLLSSLANVSGFQFAGVSNNGTRLGADLARWPKRGLRQQRHQLAGRSVATGRGRTWGLPQAAALKFGVGARRPSSTPRPQLRRALHEGRPVSLSRRRQKARLRTGLFAVPARVHRAGDLQT